MLDWLVYEKGLIAMPHCLCLYKIGHDQLASLSDDFFPRPVYNDTLLRIVKKSSEHKRFATLWPLNNAQLIVDFAYSCLFT